MEKVLSGVDLSYANSKITDITAFENAVDFVILRAGYGKNNIDAKLDYYVEQLKYRCTLGFYWFSYAHNEEMATKEGEYLLEILTKIRYPGNLPVFWDYEYDSTRYFLAQTGNSDDPAIVRNMFLSFAQPLLAASYRVGLYCNADYYRKYWKGWGELQKYPIWLAYYSQGQPEIDTYMLQTTSSGKVAGLLGDVDRDILNTDNLKYDLTDNFIFDRYARSWVHYYDRWRYIGDNGQWVKNKWVLGLEGDWYYMDAEGWNVTDAVKEINGKMYIFANDGHMMRTNSDGSLT